MVSGLEDVRAALAQHGADGHAAAQRLGRREDVGLDLVRVTVNVRVRARVRVRVGVGLRVRVGVRVRVSSASSPPPRATGRDSRATARGCRSLVRVGVRVGVRGRVRGVPSSGH